MKTNVYVDGFNLYYGCLKRTPYRWLDISKLCQLLLPNNTINQIKYFTALVSARPNDPDQPVRQQTYIRALNTIQNLSVIQGRFLSSVVTMPLANPTPQDKFAQVIKSEEKGSDVNIATHLLVDGFRQDYEVAVVISNDSDLLMPIEFVANDLGLPVGILNPQKHPSRALLPVASFLKQIRPGPLSVSQFPPTLRDSNGIFSKPAGW